MKNGIRTADSDLTYVALAEAIEPVRTWNPSRSPSDEVFDYIDLSAIDQDAKLIVGAREVSCGDAPSRARQVVQSGDILVSTVRPNLNGVARVPEHLDGATASTGFCVLRPLETRIDGGYLFQWVKTKSFVADMVSKATGASYPAVSDRIILESCVPLPPLAEQKRIAGILDAADALRAKRRAALAQLDALAQSLFLDLFGDPVTNPRGWEVKTIGENVRVIGGFAFKSTDFSEEGYPVIRISNLSGDSIDLDGCVRIPIDTIGKGAKFQIAPGDTLIAMSGATTGKLGFVSDSLSERWFLNQRVGAFRLNKGANLDRQYLRSVLSSSFYQRHVSGLAGGAAQPNISGKQLESAKIPLPPLPLQQSFAAAVEAIEKQKARHREHLAGLDALFASLQHRAFRGEL